jgi:hypothetical protein
LPGGSDSMKARIIKLSVLLIGSSLQLIVSLPGCPPTRLACYLRKDSPTADSKESVAGKRQKHTQPGKA